MSHARVEELSDSDSDPDVMDISTLPSTSRDVLQPNPTLIKPTQIPTQAAVAPAHPATLQNAPPANVQQAARRWHCLYPIYFDAGATREQGRRVKKELAVANPLALTIAEAIKSRGIISLFEPLKRHSADWSNPGRVRVELRDEDGEWVATGVKNSKFILVVQYSI
jgi:signal recognition particle subunit SRP19